MTYENRCRLEVGILTMHRVLNYGSFMQAFALKSVIESLGHRVTFRDFKNGLPRHKGIKVTPPGVLNKVARIPQLIGDINGTLKKRAFRRQFNQSFRHICWDLLDAPRTPNYDLSADAMVIGSDEVFNYSQNHAFGYVPCLFGHGIDSPLILSYAASAGYADCSDVVADGMVDEIAAGLNRMAHISVRDENTRLLVEQCIGKSPTLVLDPTLIYDFDERIPQKPVVEGDYILVYAYEGRMDSDDEIQAVKDFAASQKLKLISAGSFHAWCDQNIVVAPFELLKVFNDAAYVVTDTFHGSIFSMKAAKPFATFVRDQNPLGSNSNKVRYLLQQFGMEQRIVSDLSQMRSILTTPAPHDVFKERLPGLRKSSLGFLEMALT